MHLPPDCPVDAGCPHYIDGKCCNEPRVEEIERALGNYYNQGKTPEQIDFSERVVFWTIVIAVIGAIGTAGYLLWVS